MNPDKERKREKVKKRIVSMLEKAPDHTLTLSVFFNNYKKEYGKLPDLKGLGAKKQTELLESFEDVCQVTKATHDKDGSVKLLNRTLEESCVVEKKHASSDGTRHVKDGLIDVLMKTVDGYTEYELWRLLEKEVGRNKLQDFGYRTLSDLMPDVSTIVDEYKDKNGIRRIRLKTVRPKNITAQLVNSKKVKTMPPAQLVNSKQVNTMPPGQLVNSKQENSMPPAQLVSTKQVHSLPPAEKKQTNHQDTGMPREQPPVQHMLVHEQHQHAHVKRQLPHTRVSQQYSSYVPKRNQKLYVPKEQLDLIAKDCIERLAETKKYVSIERVESLLKQHFKISSLSEINVSKIEHISSVNEHLRTQSKVNAYINAFIKVRPIVSLYELGKALNEFVANGNEFDSLQLGPLTEQPLVYEFFRFPPNGTEVPQITTGNILESLRRYLTENDLWTKKTDLKGFMEYLANIRGLQSPYELGVRITSLALTIQVLKRAQRDCSHATHLAVMVLKERTEDDLAKAFDDFVQSVIDKNTSCSSVRREYMTMTPDKLSMLLLNKLGVLFRKLHNISTISNAGIRNLSLISVSERNLCRFTEHLKKDKLFQRMFQFAVCCSVDQIEQQLTDVLDITSRQMEIASSSASSVTYQNVTPTLDEITQRIMNYLQRCLLSGNLSLVHLDRIERKLLEEFNSQHFSDLGQGTFLDVMTTAETIKKFLENNCSGLFGLGTAVHNMWTAYQPTRDDLLYFVQQCSVLQTASPVTEAILPVANALCYHYGSNDVKSLGHGSAENLVQSLKRNQNQASTSCVLFESALVTQSRNPCLTGRQKVGILGHRSKEQALICLQNCPLLEDLSIWSQWDIVFEPELGNLKDFIQKYGRDKVLNLSESAIPQHVHTSVLALEPRPGVLLKITADTSAEKLAAAALRCDARETCGHLVSMIAVNSGVEGIGLMLLSNHVKTAILKMQADQIPGGPTDGASTATKYILDCLTLLPRLICLSVAEKVFLEPLGQVVGQTKCRELLLQLALTSAQKTRLQLIGMMLGVQDWSQSFLAKVVPQSECTDALNSPAEDDLQADDKFINQVDEDMPVYMLSDEVEDLNKDLETTERKKQATNEYGDHDECEDVPELADDETISWLSESADNEATSATVDTTIDTPSQCETNPCKALIDQIRREEFGVDVVLSEDGQKLMLKQQERLGRSLDRLSKDLYSKDTHFVLELIQNADDNDYPEELCSDDSSGCPSVKFVIDKNVISVLNNECGFLEKNIRAVCDVGRTTKGKHKYGYIGQKGIGFKSVFRITDRPEIHSNGYHICFDVNSGPSGYILPHWIGSDADENEDSQQWTTRIILPLKSSIKMQSLAIRFHDIHPSLLLFLHRIKSLAVVNKVEDYTLEIKRHDTGRNIIQIKHSKSTDLWFVIRKTLDAQKISEQAKSGAEVDSTEIAMAFPVLDKEQVQVQFQPPKQPVFAFLPLRSYGFRFVIQADFDVPSSRENVDRDSLWNQWLISELHKLFVEGLQAFREHPEFDEVEAVCRFLQFVPLEDEILECFRPVASQILKELRAVSCLPALSNNDSLRWMLPSQLIIPSHGLLQEVIPSSLLQEKLGFDYLHPKVAAILNPALMMSLGVQKITLEHLIEIRRAMLLNETEQDFNKQIVASAKWMTCVYRTIDEFEDNKQIIKELLKLPTIPLTDNTMVALENTSVFFPLEKLPQQHPLQNIMMLLLRDLNMVHPHLLQCQDSVANSQVSRLLKDLQVKHLMPHDIIYHHILPVFESDQWKTKSHDLLLAYLAYIKVQIEQNPSLLKLDHLKKVAVVLTNHGPVKLVDVNVHFTPAYQNTIDLVQSLPGYNWILLHDCYIVGAQLQTDRQLWRNFFLKLGITDFLSLRTVPLSLTQSSLAHSPWSDHKDLPPNLDCYILTDKQSMEAEVLIRKNKHPSTHFCQMVILFEMLNKHWKELYKPQDFWTKICDMEGKSLKEVETSFSLLLKNSAWVPALVTSSGCTPVYDLKVPHLLYIRSNETEQLLAHHVPYVYANVSVPSNFTEFLGIRCNVTVDLLKDLLISWCRRKDNIDSEPTHFTSSLNHMKAVYQFLYNNLSRRDFLELAGQHPLIFVTDEENPDPANPTEGVFLRRDEVRWSDRSCLFAKYRASFSNHDDESILSKPDLNLLYDDIRAIFTDGMQVEPSPSLEAYTKLMLHLSGSLLEFPNPEDLLIILTILGSELSKGRYGMKNVLDIEIANIRRLIGDKKCFLEKYNHRWISLNEKPMIADEVHYEKMFRDQKGVYFIECGDRMDKKVIDSESIKVFYQMMGIHYLNQCLDVRSVTEMYMPCPPLQKYIHDIIGYIQRILVGEYPKVYATLEKKKTGAMLAAMNFVMVSKLEKVYTLKDFPEDPIVRSEKCEINNNENQFIIHKDFVDSYPEINKQLAVYFSQGDQQCRNMLRLVLNDLCSGLSKGNDDLQNVIDEYDIKTLPDSEQPWIIPEPVRVHYPQQAAHKHNLQSQSLQSLTTGESTPVTDKEFSGLTSWPPNSGVSSSHHPKGTTQGEQRTDLSMWPPPKPPSGVDVSQLPPDLRPSKYTNDESRHEKEFHKADAEGQNVAGQVKEQMQHELQNINKIHMKEPMTASQTSVHRGDDDMQMERTAEDKRLSGVEITDAKEPLQIPSARNIDEAVVDQKVPYSKHSANTHYNIRTHPLDPAMWTEHIDDDEIYENVDGGSELMPPDTVPLSERPDRHEIAVWGEKLVKLYLERLAKDPHSGVRSVVWMNEKQECGSPYDLVMELDAADGEKKSLEIFIEVKTTEYSDKDFFEISAQEFEFALAQEEKYHIYRVFNAGRYDVKLKRLINLAEKMKQKQVRLFLAV